MYVKLLNGILKTDGRRKRSGS